MGVPARSQSETLRGRLRQFHPARFFLFLILGAAAALAQSVPLGLTGAQRQVKINDADRISVWMNTVSPGYFELMRMAVVTGRAFNDRDTENSPRVVIINHAMAKLWPDGDALGRRMEISGQKIERMIA